jgi:hypothetical protein
LYELAVKGLQFGGFESAALWHWSSSIMSHESPPRGSNTVVVLMVVLAVLLVPCVGGLFLAGFGLFAFRAAPTPPPPQAPPMAIPIGPITMPLDETNVTVDSMKSSKSLFEAGD